MDRGPVALFGAIVAVGLGPALWLGAQFGTATVTPDRPPAVVEANQDNKAPGGAGAAPEDPVAEPKPKSQYVPLSATPSARPSASTAPAPAAVDGDSDATPATTEPTPSGEPSTPPTEVTTDPTGGPSTGDPDTGTPTDPPPDPDEPGDTEDGPSV
jgi:hypothetical protein